MPTPRPIIETDAEFITLPALAKLLNTTPRSLCTSFENAEVKVYKFVRPYRVRVSDANEHFEKFVK